MKSIETLTLALACACVLVACDPHEDPAGPEPGEARPALATLEIEGSPPSLGGGLLLYATIGAGQRIPLIDEHVPVDVRASSGDRELVPLHRVGDDGDRMLHHIWVVFTGPDASAEGVVARLHQVGGVLTRAKFDGTEATYHTRVEADWAAEAVRMWPGVLRAEPSVLGIPIDGTPVERLVSGGVRVQFGTGSVHDGVVQVLSGDTVRIRYVDQTGDAVERTVLVRQSPQAH